MHHLQDRDQRHLMQDRVRDPDLNVNNPADLPLLWSLPLLPLLLPLPLPLLLPLLVNLDPTLRNPLPLLLTTTGN